MWSTDDETIEKLRQLYSDADDLVEQVASSFGQYSVLGVLEDLETRVREEAANLVRLIKKL